jgi:ADP-ribosylglycohydrolase
MRVSLIGFAFNEINKVIEEAKKSTIATHNHLIGIRWAQAVAARIYLARKNNKKKDVLHLSYIL